MASEPQRSLRDDADLAAAAADVAAVLRISAVTSILDVVCRSTGLGFAAVSRMSDTHWTACAVRDEVDFGATPGDELPLQTTLCNEVRLRGQAITIDHVAEDPDFCAHEIPAMYGFQSYVSTPIIRADGSVFGTLCALDPKPNPVSTPEVTEMFRLFAELIAFHLDANERLAASEAALMNEREAAVLRDQFIAVLGHDLRNPLAAIQAGAGILTRTPLTDKALDVLTDMQESGARMSRLINDVLDFARGRLGGGLPLARRPSVHLQGVLEQVVGELRHSHPGRAIRTELALAEPVACDPDRIAQLMSNLLANALTHGAPTGEVQVRAESGAGQFQLSVTNAGEPIPEAARARLFQPFSRHRGQRQLPDGLGLGLYIAAQIAEAHEGELDVTSDAAATCFTFRMPVI